MIVIDTGARGDGHSPFISRIRELWAARDGRWLGGRGIRAVVLVALFLAGLGSFVAMTLVSLAAVFVIPASDIPLLGLLIAHVAADWIAGLLMLAGTGALAMGRTERGVFLASGGVLVALVLADLLSFYLRQFDSIVIALFHLTLLGGVHLFRRRPPSPASASR